jgi:hypothetical protein
MKHRSMRIHLIVSVIIIAIAAGLNRHFDERLTTANSERAALSAKAAEFGISAETNRPTRHAVRPGIEHAVDAHQLARDYIGLMRKTRNGETPDETTKAAFGKIQARFPDLNATEWKIILTALLDTEDIDKEERLQISRYWLRQYLAKSNPHAALQFVKEHAAAFNDMEGVEAVVSDALRELAKNDPLAAVEWMKKNDAELPVGIKLKFQHAVIDTVASKDPELAFSLISELKFDDGYNQTAMQKIVTTAKSDDERNTTLAALRKYRDANKNDKQLSSAAERMVGYFSWGFKETGIKGAKAWIAGSNLTEKELGAFCDELSRNYDGTEHAEWIEWMGETLPPDLGTSPIMDLISRWTDRDYEAAGKWLTSAPEGPAKIAAIRGYAWHTFKHDPETAMQWIMTLPPGRDRDNTLKTIHLNWPKDDQEGAAAFAKENGIEK